METVSEAPKAPPSMDPFVDPRYEFCAPHFFDFCKGETDEEAAAAELWFIAAPSHPVSPFVGKTKSVRELSMGCSLEQYIEVQKLVVRISSELPKNSKINSLRVETTTQTTSTSVEEKRNSPVKENQSLGSETHLQSNEQGLVNESSKQESATPKTQVSHRLMEHKCCKPVDSASNVPSKRNFSELQKQDVLKNANTVKSSSNETAAAKRPLVGNHKSDSIDENQTSKKLKVESTVSHAQDKRAAKKQKLEGGRSCQVSRHAPTRTVPQEFHFNTEKRAQICRETGQCSIAQCQGSAMPYMPVAEMVQKFQMNLLNEFQNDKAASHRNRNLKLTRPREPVLGTSLRTRPPTVKSSVEIEEEFLANIPKFKARPVNKRILEAPTLPLPPRSAPHPPEFQEFHLKTMERAMVHHQTMPVAETSSMPVNRDRGATKGEFHLMTATRARPPRVKSTYELEEEAMMTKFKARPLDKRIFSSRGDVGVYTVAKRQATIPREFHFATDQRVHHHQHDVMYMEQQNMDQRFNKHWKTDRCLFNNPASNQSFRDSTAYDVQNASRFSIFNDTHMNQTRADYTASAPNSHRVSEYAERPRRPLGEIQQYVIGSATQAQKTKVDKKGLSARDNMYHQEDRHYLSSHMKNGLVANSVDESELYPVYMRSTKEIMDTLTPRTLRKEERLTQKSFPVHYMR